MITRIEIKKLYDRFDYNIGLNAEGITILTGPNGYGKTTILNIINYLGKGNIKLLKEIEFEKIILYTDKIKFTIYREDEDIYIDEIFTDKKDKKILENYTKIKDLVENITRFNEELDNFDSKDKGKMELIYLIITRIDQQIDQQIDRERYFTKVRYYERYKSKSIYKFEEENLHELNRWVKISEYYKKYINKNDYELEYDSLYELNRFKKMTKSYIEQLKSFLKNKILDEIKSLIRESIGKVYFIRAQRLIKYEGDEYKHLHEVDEYKHLHEFIENGSTYSKSRKNAINTIEELPDKFKSIIMNKSNDYSAISNKLDSSYPSRLFATKDGITEEEYDLSIEDIKHKFGKIRKYDISDMQPISDVKFDKEHAKALKVYFSDFHEKYSVYEDFINKLELFTNIINNKLQFKELKISRHEGIKIFDDKGNDVKLSYLSSGEKEIIILFFELIFNSEQKALLLIDEPEISLHVAWQNEFINDIMSISQSMNLTIIVATHSPQIIGENWDKQIDLGELYE
ncbi:excinuclease ATPase [[Clostridium] sordellii]|uniref:AAA family ATPase n=1 Tax=Paraclostridium sordellii TaxID=1505 RepID=UPI000542696F|nr:AAA family ATPase [Paeniclostridium sordellii]CEK29404.1 excinuclease ATPase [[Clostridium] sordellii] [Paeniclostridium sordellii]